MKDLNLIGILIRVVRFYLLPKGRAITRREESRLGLSIREM